MKQPIVHFTELRTNLRRDLLDKTAPQLEQTGRPDKIDRGDLVAVKLHLDA